MNDIPLWTSTQFQNWKTDCTKYVGTHQRFQVQDVYKPEHEQFCANVCELHHYSSVLKNRIVFCTPDSSLGTPSDVAGLPQP